MELSCIESNGFEVYSNEFSPIDAYNVVEAFPSSPGGRTYYAGSVYSPTRGEITWEIIEDKSKRRFNVEAKYSFNLRDYGSGEREVVTRYSALFDAKSYEIQTDDNNHFYALIYPDEENQGQPHSSRFFVYDNGRFYNANAYDYSQLSPEQNPKNYTSKIEEARLTRVDNPATWIIRFYDDGNFLQDISTQAYLTDPHVFSPEVIEHELRDSYQALHETFSKKSGTEGVEVLPNPDIPHQAQVWLVTLDEEGEETDRELILSIDNKEGRSPPYVSIVCTEIEGCLDDEYQLDCGTHFCCYQPDGVATKRIDK